jgi:hypothetical protein
MAVVLSVVGHIPAICVFIECACVLSDHVYTCAICKKKGVQYALLIHLAIQDYNIPNYQIYSNIIYCFYRVVLFNSQVIVFGCELYCNPSASR